jgi:peroxiredoxin
MIFTIGLLSFGCRNGDKNNKSNEIKVDDSFFRIPIKQTNGNYYNLGEAEKMTASVFIFLNPECPICQSYSSTMNNLYEKFKGNAVMLYGVFPGKYYNKEQIEKYISDYKIQFCTLNDPDMKMVKTLKAKITPEVFVLYHSNKIAYHGCIDNSNYSLGKHRTVVTEHYLNDILYDIVQNKFKSAKNNEAIGCIIE